MQYCRCLVSVFGEWNAGEMGGDGHGLLVSSSYYFILFLCAGPLFFLSVAGSFRRISSSKVSSVYMCVWVDDRTKREH